MTLSSLVIIPVHERVDQGIGKHAVLKVHNAFAQEVQAESNDNDVMVNVQEKKWPLFQNNEYGIQKFVVLVDRNN